MFSKYFEEQSVRLHESLVLNLDKRGIQLPGKEKDLTIYKELFTFIREHIPSEFSLATGRIRNNRHILNKNCDMLIYKKWCQKFLEMSGGYILSDFVHVYMGLEADLTTEGVFNHSNMTNAVKSLYALGETDGETVDPERIIPLYSVLFAYKSSIPLLSHKKAISDAAEEKSLPLNHMMDMICVLDQGLIIRDWEKNGSYRVIETGKDTLLWFYTLLLEYLDRDGTVGLDPRKYIKDEKEYEEY